MLRCPHENTLVLRMLLALGASLGQGDSLQVCWRHGTMVVVVNSILQGNTPLHWAILGNRPAMVNWLVLKVRDEEQALERGFWK